MLLYNNEKTFFPIHKNEKLKSMFEFLTDFLLRIIIPIVHSPILVFSLFSCLVTGRKIKSAGAHADGRVLIWIIQASECGEWTWHKAIL